MPIPEDRPVPPSAYEPGRAPDDPSGGRRRVLTVLSQAFLALWGLGAAAAVGAYLKAPAKREAERMVSAGPLEGLRVGEGRMVRHGVTPFFVVRLDATRVVAISAVCSHVRCILGYDPARKILVCPCHDGRFDLSGNVLSGPPPRPLPVYPVSVRAGEVFVQV